MVIDILNALIQTHAKNKKDTAIIKLHGVLVDILCEIPPKYKPYITRDNKGVKQLLLHCQSALYETMVSSLLYYHKFTKSLTDIGF